MITRREAIKTTLLAGAALAATGVFTPASLAASNDKAKEGNVLQSTYPFTLPPLGYAFDALEPAIDARTMEIHHDKHHAAYVNNLNKALADAPEELRKKTLAELLADIDSLPEGIRTAVRNNAGGHANHSLFWKLLKKGGSKPNGDLAEAIKSSFGSMEEFEKQFDEAASKVFGSGWAWLVVTPDKKLAIESTPNQDSPLMKGQTPLLGLDVWEHAYYLHYQNRRPEYIKAFHDIIDWDFVGKEYDKAIGK